MRVKFLKSIASIFGGFVTGMVADIPNEAVAASWCRAGICEETTGSTTAEARQTIPQKRKVAKDRPTEILKGMFWCTKCRALHKLLSPTGMKHRKHGEDKMTRKIEEPASATEEEESASVAQATSEDSPEDLS